MRLPRLYPILDADLLARRNTPLTAAAEALLEGGARILQLRVKQHFSREIFAQAQTIAAACRHTHFIINDRADIALLIENAGLHLGQDDLPPTLARRLIGPHRILGHSTHNPAQLAAADQEPADYLAIGPIFATGSKAKPDPTLGLAALPALRQLTGKPLVAIGGITRANCREAIGAGADAVAVIADLLPEPRKAVEEFLAAMRDL